MWVDCLAIAPLTTVLHIGRASARLASSRRGCGGGAAHIWRSPVLWDPSGKGRPMKEWGRRDVVVRILRVFIKRCLQRVGFALFSANFEIDGYRDRF